MGDERRVVCWFSAGVTSAVASRIAIAEYGPRVQLVYLDTRSEHPDNDRFIRECEEWLGVKVERLASTTYKDIWDVFEKTRWLVGVAGARCTTELKKKLRFKYQRPDDVHVFGYDSSEAARAKRFRANNHDITVSTPLIDAGISKRECAQMIVEAGIELPAMYKLGFTNNNCIGCVKGGINYWLAIKKHFPEEFLRMSRVERELDVAICKRYIKGVRTRTFLDELRPGMGKGRKMEDISCGIGCGQQELALALDGED